VRAALRLFEPFLPERAMTLRNEIGWVYGALGEVRDLEVQIDHLKRWRARVEPDERAALDTVRRLLEERREAARTAMLHVLDARRYEHIIATCIAMLRQGTRGMPPAARRPVLSVAPDLLRRSMRKLKRAGQDIDQSSSAAELHALRIRCRRLRYALEFVGPLYGKKLKRVVRTLVALQDLLGMHQDAEVRAERLRELCRTHEPAFPRHTVLAVGQIAGRSKEQAARLREHVPTLLAKARGRRWRRLRRAMHAAR
jgi:CHAD domain-containing protein